MPLFEQPIPEVTEVRGRLMNSLAPTAADLYHAERNH
jgi:hypothetical protein